ncbi:nucleotidyl transferase AbiEii/AbiGii toxin family protein [Solwaraspora sp. WMMA2065]|uniref:nucleotidyl transferase AbiEii/AbiGii toxin family protein n=1 Tax=Solwaraspora sp. WMMA2065 TaxID=3015166 RepID=UPI00259BE9E9|nr:nucleotidyl transferase AbiEii/AbiGii toxin family protein [Solwaraspora sp. WMMA2065]WJK33364.1 nucleotidyl transferase AbiEii/AbiGii toxin family protein [Solwaraspora sp. WMMA2065]
MNTDNPYRSPAAFRSAIDTKLKAVARDSDRPFVELRREFLYQRFLARVFDDSESAWVLKGGIGLLTRLPGARHSRDIDLLHLTSDPVEAEAELRRIGRRDLGDHLRFEVRRSIPLSVEDALRLKTEAYTGATKWESFDIDVSCERHFVASVEPILPTPVLQIDSIPALPPFRLYPLVDQIADKITAMYETHGGVPSNRYRDLVDLVLLVDIEQLDAGLLSSALAQRVRYARSPVTLPDAMCSPGQGWPEGYRAAARRSSLPADLHRIEAALQHVGRCLDPILGRQVPRGRWTPSSRRWITDAP